MIVRSDFFFFIFLVFRVDTLAALRSLSRTLRLKPPSKRAETNKNTPSLLAFERENNNNMTKRGGEEEAKKASLSRHSLSLFLSPSARDPPLLCLSFLSLRSLSLSLSRSLSLSLSLSPRSPQKAKNKAHARRRLVLA